MASADKLIKRILLRAGGLMLSILPPLAAILCYFPIWATEGGETVVSGFTALLIILAALPLYKALRKLLASPSVWSMWLIAFVVFLLLSKVAEEMVVICFVGFVSNLLGAALFRLARKYEVTQ